MSLRPARYISTRSSNRIAAKSSNVQNENVARPPLPGKGFLRETTNKVFGLKRKAENVIDNNKATKKRSAFGDITNVSLFDLV